MVVLGGWAFSYERSISVPKGPRAVRFLNTELTMYRQGTMPSVI